jgi:16S rRNA pseudouridine516 synthase
VDKEDAAAFSRGIVLRDGTQCLPAELELLGGGRCLVTVMEGKYHQVRRMLASRGKPVLALRRLSIGGLQLGEELGAGGFRELDEGDLCTLFNA